jgi:hypothetical protein
MSEFSLTDAAFEGFRLTRERPGVVGAWALVYGLLSLVITAVTITVLGPQAGELDAAARGVMPSNTAEAVRQSRALAPMVLITVPIMLVFWSVFTCAVYRAILQPGEGGFGRLRLGGDEVRMMGLIVLLFVLTVCTISAYTVADRFGAIVAATAGAAGAVIGNLIRLAAFAAICAFWIRMSLAGPATFTGRRIRLFRSWVLTRGHFWRLAAAYGMAICLALVVVLLALVIFTGAALMFAAAAGVKMNHVEQIFQPDLTSFAAYFTPAQVFNQVFSSLLLVAVFIVLLSPAAIIHRDLSAETKV